MFVLFAKALVVACEENATLMAHKLLATCSSEEVAAFGPCLIESAARFVSPLLFFFLFFFLCFPFCRHANPELTAVLLSRGAQRSGGAVRLALQSGRPDEDVTRVLLALLRRGAGFSSSSSAADPRLEVAMRMLADPRPAVIEGAPLQRARLVGAEPDFVNDTPVPAPRHFECHLRSGAVTTIGRSDPVSKTTHKTRSKTKTDILPPWFFAGSRAPRERGHGERVLCCVCVAHACPAALSRLKTSCAKQKKRKGVCFFNGFECRSGRFGFAVATGCSTRAASSFRRRPMTTTGSTCLFFRTTSLKSDGSSWSSR
jgi:hypothetical protein